MHNVFPCLPYRCHLLCPRRLPYLPSRPLVFYLSYLLHILTATYLLTRNSVRLQRCLQHALLAGVALDM